MKVTIELAGPDESDVPELYYRALAEMLGRHVAELASLGNMDISYVATIYRKIADAIDQKNIDIKDIYGDRGASLVKDGFLDNLEPLRTVLRSDSLVKSSDSAQNSREFWINVERLHEVERINNGFDILPERADFLTSLEIAQKFCENINHVVALMETVIPKIEKIAEDYGVVVVKNRPEFLHTHDGYVDASSSWGIQSSSQGKPVVGWTDSNRPVATAVTGP